MSVAQILQRNRKPFAVAAAGLVGYIYYRTRLREVVATAPVTVSGQPIPQAQYPKQYTGASSTRPSGGSAESAYLNQMQATQLQGRYPTSTTASGEDVDSAWFELQGAVRDARRHAAYLENEFVAYKDSMQRDPGKAEEEMRDAIEDAKAHADFVSSQVNAFGRLAGYDTSALMTDRRQSGSSHPFAGPPSTVEKS